MVATPHHTITTPQLDLITHHHRNKSGTTIPLSEVITPLHREVTIRHHTEMITPRRTVTMVTIRTHRRVTTREVGMPPLTLVDMVHPLLADMAHITALMDMPMVIPRSMIRAIRQLLYRVSTNIQDIAQTVLITIPMVVVQVVQVAQVVVEGVLEAETMQVRPLRVLEDSSHLMNLTGSSQLMTLTGSSHLMTLTDRSHLMVDTAVDMVDILVTKVCMGDTRVMVVVMLLL
mmetsp:Transcript_20710/g.30780  ORF Transcript_20710/g.30780 Transcript_20710/m.30780 type:complete len:231 (-) Transcript_20710:354-1046(-)